MHRLTRNELRIIEETKREGAELQQREEAEGATRRGIRVWSLVAFVLIFVLMVLGIRLVVGLITNG